MHVRMYTFNFPHAFRFTSCGSKCSQCEVIVSVTSTAKHAGRVAAMCLTGLCCSDGSYSLDLGTNNIFLYSSVNDIHLQLLKSFLTMLNPDDVCMMGIFSILGVLRSVICRKQLCTFQPRRSASASSIRTFWVYFPSSARTDPCLQIYLALWAVHYATLHLWMVIKDVLEVVVNVGELPVHTGGLFASILHVHIEERNWSLGLLLNGELDSVR